MKASLRYRGGPLSFSVPSLSPFTSSQVSSEWSWEWNMGPKLHILGEAKDRKKCRHTSWSANESSFSGVQGYICQVLKLEWARFADHLSLVVVQCSKREYLSCSSRNNLVGAPFAHTNERALFWKSLNLQQRFITPNNFRSGSDVINDEYKGRNKQLLG